MFILESMLTERGIDPETVDLEQLDLEQLEMDFPTEDTEADAPNRKSRKGMEQTVYPIKRMDQLENMADWLYEHRDPQYVTAFQLGINLGLRANELLGMKVGDVFFPDGTVKHVDDMTDVSDRIAVYQSKTRKRRGVFLNEACVRALEWRYPDEESRLRAQDYLVASREGENKPILVNTLRRVLKEAAAACHIRMNVGTHTMRKTWGWWQHNYCYANSAAGNADVSHLQNLFGHSSSSTTLRYIGITDEEDKRAFNAVSLDVLTPILAKR